MPNETQTKIKRYPTKWKKMFAHNLCEKEPLFKIHKALIKLSNKKFNKLIQKLKGRGDSLPKTLPQRRHTNGQ